MRSYTFGPDTCGLVFGSRFSVVLIWMGTTGLAGTLSP
jgi:hypothetical protein